MNNDEENVGCSQLREYNSNDYKILHNFIKQNKVSKGSGVTAMKGLTLKDIAEQTELSLIKVRKTIACFFEDAFIKEGIKKVRAKTYYISESGLKELKRIKELH